MGAFRSAFLYTNDAGVEMNIILTNARADAGGFTPTTNNNLPVVKANGIEKVRGVHGINTLSAQARTFLPCVSNDKVEEIFTAGTFNVGAATFQVTGRRGERWTA